MYDDYMWNGYDCRNVTSAGALKGGIEKTKEKMVGRGVLLDVPRAMGKKWLPDGFAVTNELLDFTAKKLRVEVRRGDFLLVRTGHVERKLRGQELGWLFRRRRAGTRFRNARLAAQKRSGGDRHRYVGRRSAAE